MNACGPAARRVGEAARDVAEEEAVGLALALGLLAQAAPQLLDRHRHRRLHHEVALARHDGAPLLPAPVAVRFVKPARRRTAEQEAPQHALVDQRGALGGHRLVVEAVKAVEVDAADARQRRIVVDRHEARHDRLADLLGEGLPLLLVLLAVPLDAVAEDLVEEDAGGAPLEDRRPDEGSASGARRSALRSAIIASAPFSISASPASASNEAASKLSKRSSSMPSSARVSACMKTRT